MVLRRVIAPELRAHWDPSSAAGQVPPISSSARGAGRSPGEQRDISKVGRGFSRVPRPTNPSFGS